MYQRLFYVHICTNRNNCILYGLKVHSAGYGSAFLRCGLHWEYFYILYMGSVVWFMDAPAEVVQDSIYCTVCGMPWFFAVIEACIASRINSKGEDNLDYIIVLGAMIREDGPSSILKARLDSAIEYLDGNPGTKCIVSGGQGYDEPCSEAEGMRKYLVEKALMNQESLWSLIP